MAVENKRMWQRGALEADLLAADEVPADREMIVASDTGRVWPGDGVSPLSARPFLVTADPMTGQMPDDVREVIAANLADPTTPEGVALAEVIAGSGLDASLTYTIIEKSGSSAVTLSTDSGSPAFAAPARVGTAALRGGTLAAAGRTPQPVDPMKPMTVEAWVNPAAHTANTYVIISAGAAFGQNGFWIGINNSDQLIYNDGNGTVAIPASVTVGTWTHIAVEFWSDLGYNRVTGIWINGNPVALPASTPGYVGWTNIVAVGSLVGNSVYQFPGAIDEFRVSSGKRYAGTFTPASTPASFDALTLILAHLDSASALTTGLGYPDRPDAPNGAVVWVGTLQPDGMQPYDTWRKVPA